MSLKDIGVFCRRNNCSIDVYAISNGKDDQEDVEDGEMEDDQEVDEIGDGDTKSSINNQRKKGKIDLLKVSKVIIKERHVNLLLTEKDGQYHYTTIINFSRVVSSQMSGKKCQHFYCYRCMQGTPIKNYSRYRCMQGHTNKELLKIPLHAGHTNKELLKIPLHAGHTNKELLKIPLHAGHTNKELLKIPLHAGAHQ